MDIGVRIKEIRKKKNISQKEFAEMMKTSQQKISKIENGQQGIFTDDLSEICQSLNISADYLLGLTDNPAIDLPEDDQMLIDLVNNYNKLSRTNKYRLLAESADLLDFQEGKTDKRKKGGEAIHPDQIPHSAAG